MTPQPFDEPLLASFSRCVSARTGLRFGRERWFDLQRVIDGLTAGCEMNRDDALRAWMAQTPPQAQAEAFAQHLAVGETYFFREPAAFDLLEFELLPPLIAARRESGRRLRLWSAGCCTGEEAYSLAIVLSRLIPDLSEWDVSILGTDIHPGFLALAEQGSYGDWSFRGVPEAVRCAYFDTVGGGQRHVVHEPLRRITHFCHGNLIEPCASDCFDLVLCRNVLMYFGRRQAQQVVERLHGALVEGGLLLVGPTESASVRCTGLETLGFEQATFHRKRAPAIEPLAIRAPRAARVIPAEPVRRAERKLRPARAAIAACEAAVAADPCNPTLHYLHALLLEQGNRLAEARHALRRVLFLDDRFVLAHVMLARLCEREGRGELAQRHRGLACAEVGGNRPVA